MTAKLHERYNIFIHKSIVYSRDDKHVRKYEHPTISGLVFVQGKGNEIQQYLKENFFNQYLVKDCSTGQIAVIPDSVMQSFMRVSEVSPTRIRFMPHPFDYYSTGNPLIRITSGVLAGLEGYRIRISRDKCFVTSIGGMTVAIGGIYKENFENLDEYVRLRREHLKPAKDSSSLSYTPLQQEIDRCFFTPQNELDVMAISSNLVSWITRMQVLLKKKQFDDSVEIALFLLEEIGSRFLAVYTELGSEPMTEILSQCREADSVLLSVMKSPDVSVDLKEIVATGRESLAIRFPFLAIEL